jgi:cytochrome c biogenesis protein CcmG, thiol:disulfide interchange protein DsbE
LRITVIEKLEWTATRARQACSRFGGGVALAAALVLLAGCGQAQPKSAATKSDFKAALAGAPKPLHSLYSHPSEIVDRGLGAYKRQLEALRGYPVVVNKWASWCAPCRFEFPFFQRLARRDGKRIAFIGVDSRDSKGDAKRFLAKFPVPYPSFFDPGGEIARSFRGDRVSPETAFYDSKGQLSYTKPGGYASLAAIARDIARYAR